MLKNDGEEEIRGVIKRESGMKEREIGGDWIEGGRNGRKGERKGLRDRGKNDNVITVVSK